LQGYLRSRRAKGKGFAADAEVGSGSGCCGTVSSKWAKGTGGPAGDECYNLIAQPTAYRWQNDRDGLQQDDAVAALRASQGASGFHEMNHPVIAQPVPFTKSKRAQSTSDDETWVDGQVNPTLSLFDQGDTRATTVAVAFDWQKGNDIHNPRPSTMNVQHECTPTIGTTRTPAVAHAFYSTRGTHGVNQHPEVSPAVKVGSGLGIPSPPAVAFTVGNAARGQGPSPSSEVFPTLKSGEGRGLDDQWPSVMTNMTVRRLTPRECERLQGFPDDWTMIPYRGKPPEQCPDGPRYKALGNSMACNCMAWIGERIAAYENHNP
jgi:DNA (cytosine-5)-methyltransferase 1